MTSAAQAKAALQIANEVRLNRVALRQDLRGLTKCEGLRRAADVLAVPPEWTLRMKVYSLIVAVRHISPDQALSMMTEASIRNLNVTVGGLAHGQRNSLIAVLRGVADRADPTPRPKVANEDPEPRARRRGPRCKGCKIDLLRPSPDGLCGFCRFEIAEARGQVA